MATSRKSLGDRDEVLLRAAGFRVLQVAPVEQQDAQGHVTSTLGVGTALQIGWLPCGNAIRADENVPH